MKFLKAISALLLLSSCQLFQTIDLKSYPEENRSIFIQNFKNESFQPDVSAELTEWIRRETSRRQNFLVSEERPRARLILSGRLEVYRKEGRMIDDYRNPLRYELIIAATVRLREQASDGQQEIGAELLSASVEFSDQEGYIESEDTARQRCLQLLAARALHFAERSFVNHYGAPPDPKKLSPAGNTE